MHQGKGLYSCVKQPPDKTQITSGLKPGETGQWARAEQEPPWPLSYKWFCSLNNLFFPCAIFWPLLNCFCLGLPCYWDSIVFPDCFLPTVYTYNKTLDSVLPQDTNTPHRDSFKGRCGAVLRPCTPVPLPCCLPVPQGSASLPWSLFLGVHLRSSCNEDWWFISPGLIGNLARLEELY